MALSKLSSHISSKVSFRNCIVSGNWAMLVYNAGGFMTASENYQFHKWKYLNKLLKECNRGYNTQGSRNHRVQFGDIATYTIIHSITILITHLYFQWDFLIFLCQHWMQRFSLNDKVLSKITAIQWWNIKNCDESLKAIEWIHDNILFFPLTTINNYVYYNLLNNIF